MKNPPAELNKIGELLRPNKQLYVFVKKAVIILTGFRRFFIGLP